MEHIYSGKSDSLLLHKNLAFLQKNPPNTIQSLDGKEAEPLTEAERAPHRFGLTIWRDDSCGITV